MGLSLVVSRPVDRDWFTSAELVRGVVVWEGKLTPSRIIVYLEGQNEISAQPSRSCFGRNSNRQQHALFIREKVVHQANDDLLEKNPNALRNGKHTFPFELRFPALTEVTSNDTQGCPRCQKGLPPSFKFVSDTFSASVEYRVRVIAEKPGKLLGNVTTVENIDFRPLLPTRHLLTDQPFKVINRLDAVALGLQGQYDGDKPSISFELAFPSSKTVRPGRRIDLGMNFVIPVELQRVWKQIWIFHVVVKLKTITKARFSGGSKSHQFDTDACDVKGVFQLGLPAEYPRVVVPPELWQHYIYPTILPTLRLCNMQRTHALDVLVKFASPATNRTHSARAQLDVIVESGAMSPSEAPPAYA